jgi:hypothetical protein
MTIWEVSEYAQIKRRIAQDGIRRHPDRAGICLGVLTLCYCVLPFSSQPSQGD